MARTRVPRASFGVTVLDDIDFAALMELGPPGYLAWTVFSTLIIQAKKSRHNGFFPEHFKVTSRLIQVDANLVREGIETIAAVCSMNGTQPWIKINGEGRIHIRSFMEWQTSDSWGGNRRSGGQDDGNLKSSCSQDDEQLAAPLLCSDSDSDRSSEGRGGVGEKPSSERPWTSESCLNTDRFAALWEEWMSHRRHKRASLTPEAIRRQILKLERFGEELAIQAIEQSIEQGWTGVFDPRDNGKPGSKPDRSSETCRKALRELEEDGI